MPKSVQIKTHLEPKGFLWFSPEYLSQKTLLVQILRKFRRMLFSVFHREYIAQSIAMNRQGECHRCGMCCKLINKCPFLGTDSQNLPFCRVYGELRPAACNNYPFDRVDSEIKQCGFKFK